MEIFYYAYILVSKNDPQKHYIGLTKDIKNRLKKHNYGHVPHTSKYCPWKYETVIAFSSKQKAMDFEKYLKSHSGRSFSTKHF